MNQFKRIFLFLLVSFSFFQNCDGGGSGTDFSGLLLLTQNGSSQGFSPCPPNSVPSEYFLANTVVDAPGNDPSIEFKDPTKAINGVCGGGQYSGGFDVYTIGNASGSNYLILSWGGSTVLNQSGIDFIVFENGFRQASSVNYFLEPMVVEVSYDGTNYCGFYPEYVGSPSPVSLDPDNWLHFAGLLPVLWNMGTNPLTPAQIFPTPFVANAGGDAFDINDLKEDARFSNGCNSSVLFDIQTNGFKYIKLINNRTDFPTPSGSFDGGPDVDGVLARTVSP
ncbi:LIC_13355 family lipoprotein [Leptospira wolffii]|uniref:LIC_13355 family lipoprotein n=1 Tax=Leptospira wolffii TaxID=409998 RepID=A0ABV5BNA8_9LEPT|nr:LIC_13355 family lipoprotein [Leptospira wolffii]TGL52612.1 LIC_13355 family lipoprotein [Leptospira wolffii]